MILNWCEELINIDPSIDFRKNGGWLKTVEGIDKTVKNGYSIIGEFVKAGDYSEELDNGLYLDCNKEGKKSKPKQDIRLIRVHDGEVVLIDAVYNAGKNWAVDLWDSIGEELDPNYKYTQCEEITTMVLNKTGKNKELIKDVISLLEKRMSKF